MTTRWGCYDVGTLASKANHQEAAVCARDQAGASVESCEITIAANQYIEDHPEIITFATEEYHRLVASGRLKPQRQKKLCST